MTRPDADDVLNYLSIKFNKIFCDREFVCCVIEDFQKVFDKKKQRRILVFPTLGPIYLKALRYQARIFDLAVFNITSASGRFKSLAVCHKNLLQKSTPMKDSTMSEATSKRKRPERQLYVPPAQRGSRLSKTDTKMTQDCDNSEECQKFCKNKEFSNGQCSSDPSVVVLSLSDIVNSLYYFKSFKCDFLSSTKNHYQHQNCKFRQLQNLKKSTYNHFIEIYSVSTFTNVCWRLSQFCCLKRNHLHFMCVPVFEFDTETAAERPSAVLVNYELSDYCESVLGLEEFESGVYKIQCDHVCDVPENNNMIDLAGFELGHFFIVSIEESEYFHECQQKHNTNDCYTNVRKELENMRHLKKLNICAIQSDSDETTEKNCDEEETPKIDKDIVKNQINKKKVSDNKHEQEKQIMRMTKEYINRKTRPIMKYVDDANDTLKIDENDSVNNWEDLFDDDGQIQERLLTEIIDKVGDDVTIVKAAEDYTAYTIKPPEDLEHVVELYNFPATLETHDLVQAFSDINSDAMYIKWVDDTHALLVLGSLSQAQKAINMGNPLIKVRPMTAASPVSMDVANKSDLKPAMKRPPTNLQTARRLITTHLGTKSKLTKEQIAKEKQDLKNARDMKRLIKQNEKDAWEGNLRSSVN